MRQLLLAASSIYQLYYFILCVCVCVCVQVCVHVCLPSIMRTYKHLSPHWCNIASSSPPPAVFHYISTDVIWAQIYVSAFGWLYCTLLFFNEAKISACLLTNIWCQKDILQFLIFLSTIYIPSCSPTDRVVALTNTYIHIHLHSLTSLPLGLQGGRTSPHHTSLNRVKCPAQTGSLYISVHQGLPADTGLPLLHFNRSNPLPTPEPVIADWNRHMRSPIEVVQAASHICIHNYSPLISIMHNHFLAPLTSLLHPTLSLHCSSILFMFWYSKPYYQININTILSRP